MKIRKNTNENFDFISIWMAKNIYEKKPNTARYLRLNGM